MSDKIKWVPDENGAPMCDRTCLFMGNAGDADNFDPICTHPVTEALVYDLQTCPMMCYPQMVKMMAALKALVALRSNSDNDPMIELMEIIGMAKLAVTP